MFTALHRRSGRLSARIGRWPRRLACAACLLLAALSALGGTGSDSAAGRPLRSGPAAQLRPGEVAVPVTLADPAAAGYLRPGDQLGLLADPASPVTGQPSGRASVLAEDVRVLAITRSSGIASGADEGATLLVAARRDQALRIAAAAADAITPILDVSP